MTTDRIRLAAALDGAGWHPSAWREPQARPRDLFTADYWIHLVATADRAMLDFVTFEDAMSIQSSDPTRVRGRLDSIQVAARVAPSTRAVGLVPTVTVTHTEPFHTSRAIATLDQVSHGRAGWCVRVSTSRDEAALVGRRDAPGAEESLAEAADYVEVVRRLWDSWEDDAEIRDGATKRFLDADRVHHIDFNGRWFSVKGPSVTSRPPQGQPVVCVPASDEASVPFAVRAADVVLTTPRDLEQARRMVSQIRAAQADDGRADQAVHVFADLTVFLDAQPEAAADRRSRLDGLGGRCPDDARTVTGTSADLADLLVEWRAVGVTGFRLRPATIPHDLDQICGPLVAELRRRAVFRTGPAPGTLRGHLGLPRPRNRYATARTG